VSRIHEIRDEATKQERYWRGRRVGAVRLAMTEAAEAGMTPAQAGEWLGVPVSTIYNYVKRYGIKLRRAYAGRSWCPNFEQGSIEICATPRETAIRNRGRASASAIAQACGISRNAVIGHWFRARASGAIQ
jgi:hypothetical protein